MIVPAMSITEIHKELSRDYDYCLTRIQRDLNHYRRAIIKSSKFPICFKPIDYVTPSRNHFILFLEAKSKKNANDPYVTFVGYYLRPEGIYAAMLIPDYGGEKKIILYPPHFFERYKQRYLNEDVCTLDAIKTYFRINPTNIIEFIDAKRFRGSCNEGFVFGEMLNSNIFIVKTFVSKAMLKGEQVDLNEDFVNYLSELNNRKTKQNYSINTPMNLDAKNIGICI
jgi:hypothetical protein